MNPATALPIALPATSPAFLPKSSGLFDRFGFAGGSAGVGGRGGIAGLGARAVGCAACGTGAGSGAGNDDVPFDLDGSLTEIDTGKIDYDYMNTRFAKFLVSLNNGNPDEIASVKNELHSTFATLTAEEQKHAGVFLSDLESGKVRIVEGKLFKDYVSEYMQQAKDDAIHKVAEALGVNEDSLREFKRSKVTAEDIDRFGRFSALKATADLTKAKAYLEERDRCTYPIPRVRQKMDKMLREFIINDVFQ